MEDRTPFTLDEHAVLGGWLTYTHYRLSSEIRRIEDAVGEESEAAKLSRSVSMGLGDLRRVLEDVAHAEHPDLGADRQLYAPEPASSVSAEDGPVVLGLFDHDQSTLETQCYLALVYDPRSLSASVLGMFPDVEDARSVLRVQLARINADPDSDDWAGVVLPVWTNLTELPPTGSPRLSVVEESTHG